MYPQHTPHATAIKVSVPEPPDSPALTADEAKHLKMFRSLSPSRRAKLIGFALGLAVQRDDPADPT